ncbi:RluA family pseudouridine synthase [Ureaplasma ceti]|uniref:Pseudouridine synthase n=1 Tax=Ureaplasma ceti TaxID=3119530 RepID=A0ABP9UC86_9BACT
MEKTIIVPWKVDRLDKFLTEELAISRSQIKKMIDDNLIYVNDELVSKSGMALEKDAVIVIKDSLQTDKAAIVLQPLDAPLDILLETEDLMVLNKPTGLLIHPTEHNEPDTLAARLKHYFIQNNNHEFDNSIRPGIVHRLDKDTSGLIIVAKNQVTLEKLQQMMQKNLVKRKYYALVHNCFDLKNNKIFRVNAPIGRSLQNKSKMQVNSSKDAKEAITIVKVVQNISNTNALVECELMTGRTHQIRAHMQFINHPVVNDKVYGIEKNPSDFGQYLMCHEVQFYNPMDQKLVHINLPIPQEFQERINELTNEKM